LYNKIGVGRNGCGRRLRLLAIAVEFEKRGHESGMKMGGVRASALRPGKKIPQKYCGLAELEVIVQGHNVSAVVQKETLITSG